MDLGDIRRVVQFMITRKLTQWTQHAGRCGRDGQPAIAILLVEPSVFQKVRRKKVKYDGGKIAKSNGSKEAPKNVTWKKTIVKVEAEENPLGIDPPPEGQVCL